MLKYSIVGIMRCTYLQRRLFMQTAKWRGVVVAGVMMALVGAPMVAGVAFAAGNKHQAEAVEHAKEAVSAQA